MLEALIALLVVCFLAGVAMAISARYPLWGADYYAALRKARRLRALRQLQRVAEDMGLYK